AGLRAGGRGERQGGQREADERCHDRPRARVWMVPTHLVNGARYGIWWRSGDAPELGDSAHFDPLDHEDVAIVIEDGAVGGDELAGDELVARLVAQAEVGAIAEVGDEPVALIKGRD